MNSPDMPWRTDTERSVEYRAAVYLGRGNPVAAELDDAMQSAEQQMVWIQIRRNPDANIAKLAELFTLPPEGIHQLFEVELMPKYREIGPWAILAVLKPYSGEPQGPEQTQLGFMLSERILVTIVRQECPITDPWFGSWMNNPPAIGTTPAEVLANIVDDVVDGFFPVIDEIEDEVEDMEEQVFANLPFSIPAALRLKRKLLGVRKAISPTRDALNALMRRDAAGFTRTIRAEIQDVYDHSLRLIERCDVNRELIADVLDGHQSVVANQMNTVMKTLTVISTMLMSVALITGVYGMNFTFMPETEAVLGYPITLGAMVLVAWIEWIIFRKKGWI